MKNPKNSIWLNLTVIFFLMFIIALFAIGFKFDQGKENPTLLTLSDLISESKKDGAQSFYRSSAALLVTGLILAAINVILVGTKWVLDELNIKTKMKQAYWDYLFMGINGLAVIFIIAGTSLYVDKYKTDDAFKDRTLETGRIAGLIILTLLTTPISSIPLFMANPKDEPTTDSVEGDNGGNKPVNDDEVVIEKTTIVVDNPDL